MTRRTGVSDPQLRGGMAATQLVGMATSRYLLLLPPVVDASHDELARWIGPTLQRYLVDPV